MDLKVSLEVFEGPLDLLLHLVRREELNIYDIPIARITDQYLQYLQQMREFDLELASEFIVMAATLLEIKARMLLPRPPKADGTEAEEEADPRRMLVEQLLEYKRYKEAAEQLEQLASEESLRCARLPEEADEGPPGLPASLDLAALVAAMRSLLTEAEPEPTPEITRDAFSLRQKMDLIMARLSSAARVRFRDLFGRRFTRFEVVITFLAILELIRGRQVIARQTERLGEIYVERREAAAG
ncbi:MAG: segregation and condensation protein A [Chloroflexota bacterium]